MAMPDMAMPSMRISQIPMPNIRVRHLPPTTPSPPLPTPTNDAHPRTPDPAQVLNATSLKVSKGQSTIFIPIMNSQVVVHILFIRDKISVNRVISI